MQGREAAEVILSALEGLASLADYEFALLELIPGFGQSGQPTIFRATPAMIEAVAPSTVLVDDRAPLLPLESGGRELGRLRVTPVAETLTAEEDLALRALAGYMSLALRQAELETVARRLTEMEVRGNRRQAPTLRADGQPGGRRSRISGIKAELSHVMSAQLGLTVLCERVLERLVAVLEIDAGAIFTYDERNNELVRNAQRNVPGPLPARLLVDAMAPTALGRATAARTPQLVRDAFAASLESDEDRVLRTWGFHTLLCYPLLSGKRISGALQLMGRRTNAIGTEGLALLAALADELALALQNAVVFERLSTMAVTDGLTGLHNRRFCEEFVRKHISAAERTRRQCGFLLLDVDHFKNFNDTFGHAAGDKILRGVAGVLLASIRAADLAGRYGGEEFMVALPNADLATATTVAERIRTNVQAMPMPDGIAERVTVSVGVSCYPDCAADVTALFASGDAALYAAKAAGRNCVSAAPRLQSGGGRTPPRS
jgi:diguanylate cyclase (GGDEF)-like protein